MRSVTKISQQLFRFSGKREERRALPFVWQQCDNHASATLQLTTTEWDHVTNSFFWAFFGEPRDVTLSITLWNHVSRVCVFWPCRVDEGPKLDKSLWVLQKPLSKKQPLNFGDTCFFFCSLKVMSVAATVAVKATGGGEYGASCLKRLQPAAPAVCLWPLGSATANSRKAKPP